MNTTQDFTPQMWYDSEKAKLKAKLQESFKNSVDHLDRKLIVAQTMPSLSWYIFQSNETPTFRFFDNLENINYINDIHGVVKNWIEDTNLVLKEFCINHSTRHIPFYISHFFCDVLIAIIRNGRIGSYNRIEYHKQYIAFYEKTIVPCFKLQERITRQVNAGRDSLNKITFPTFILHFSCANNLFLHGHEAKHKRQYKKSLRIVKNAGRVERVKLFLKSL